MFVSAVSQALVLGCVGANERPRIVRLRLDLSYRAISLYPLPRLCGVSRTPFLRDKRHVTAGVSPQACRSDNAGP